MTVSRRTRRAVLTVHLTVSVGWIGAVVSYIALGVAAKTTNDSETVRSAWIAMELTGWYAITPLAIAALATGIGMAAGTPWGLLNHYWVTISLILTSFCVAVLIPHMSNVTATADLARTASDEQLLALGGDLAHPTIGLLILIAIQVLNIYKPSGLTRIGHRRRLLAQNKAE
jgi:hypothetical protein